jgi:rare lipoprotein A
VVLAAGGLCACASTPSGPVAGVEGARPRAYNRPYEVNGHLYRPEAQPDYDAVGLASWYSYEAHHRTTADGEVFDARLPTAAHTTLPIPSYLEVTNLANGRRIRVRLNDRGPFVSGRIIDLSRGAAAELGFLTQGIARVRVRYLGPAPLRESEDVATARISDSVAPGQEPGG